MLCKVLMARMERLEEDITSLYTLASNVSHPITVRLAAAGSLASFLSSSDQPIENWLLDTLTLRMGLCMVLSALGQETGELGEDIRLVKRSLTSRAIRRIESTLSRLSSSEFAGGAMSAVVADTKVLVRLYEQACTKAALAPQNLYCDEVIACAKLEKLLS